MLEANERFGFRVYYKFSLEHAIPQSKSEQFNYTKYHFEKSASRFALIARKFS